MNDPDMMPTPDQPTPTPAPPMPTNLGRTIDPRVLSNRFILIFSALAVILMGIGQIGAPPGEVVIAALGAGVFTFLAWAIGRELDPDHNLSAYVAAVLALAGMGLWGLPNLLTVGALITALRVVNRTTGLPPRLTDSLGLVVLAGVITVLSGYWLMGLMISAAFVLDSVLIDARRPSGVVFALLALGTTLLGALLVNTGPASHPLETPLNAIVILIALAYTGIVLSVPHLLVSVADFTGEPLSFRRVVAGQLLAVSAALALLMWDGMSGLVALLPVWAALTGVVVRRIVQMVRS